MCGVSQGPQGDPSAEKGWRKEWRAEERGEAREEKAHRGGPAAGRRREKSCYREERAMEEQAEGGDSGREKKNWRRVRERDGR